MSENWIILISHDPNFVPDNQRRDAASIRLSKIASGADEITVETSDKILFFTSGANFERIYCPSCHQEISPDWWSKQMSTDYENGGFRLAKFRTPCCDSETTLNELTYHWPQGFGKFSLIAKNPNIGKLDEEGVVEFENILGTSLRVIYQHI